MMAEAGREAMTLVLAAGGTGGHIFPAAATARALTARGHKVHLVTDTRGAGFGDSERQVTLHRISAARLSGRTWAKIKGVGALALGTLQAVRILRRLRPNAVIAFGGYPAAPTAAAAALTRTRLLLHEQNAYAGRVNRLFAKSADRIATSFPEVAGLPAACRDKCVLTGNPVRAEIAALYGKPYPLPQDGGPLNLLVTGGSQGASAFSQIIPAALAGLPEEQRHRIRLVQQVRGEIDEVAARYKSQGIEAELAPFFGDMPQRLSEAHLVIARAGASTIAELAAAGRPALLLPYPFATDDHQKANARQLAATGGAWVFHERGFAPAEMTARLTTLLDDGEALRAAGEAVSGFAKLDAAERLADLAEGHLPAEEPPRRNGEPQDPSIREAA